MNWISIENIFYCLNSLDAVDIVHGSVALATLLLISIYQAVFQHDISMLGKPF